METEYSKYEPLFGSWKIKKLIGEGSYGKVYEIEREDFGVTYKAALKAITIPKSKSEVKSFISEGMDEESAYTYFRGFVEEITKEFSLMDKLKGNSYIVNYEDHIVMEHEGEIGWDVLIRMELLTPLNDYLKSHPMSCKDVAQLGIDLCKALEICDKYDIIHRDIKPENIFVSELGNYKLGDFGIARVAEKTTGASTKIGTNSYMAPEIMRGDTYDSRVDIYSLGLVLFRLLNNNRLPFLPPAPEPVTYTQREEANAKRIRGEILPAPINSDERFNEIIHKAASVDLSKRYSSASELRADLERYLGIQTEPICEQKVEEPVINTIEDEQEEYEKTAISPMIKKVDDKKEDPAPIEEHEEPQNNKSWVKEAFLFKSVIRGVISSIVAFLVIMIVIYFIGTLHLYVVSDNIVIILAIMTAIGAGIVTCVSSASWGIIVSLLFELLPIGYLIGNCIGRYKRYIFNDVRFALKTFNRWHSICYLVIPIAGIIVSILTSFIKYKVSNKRSKG